MSTLSIIVIYSAVKQSIFTIQLQRKHHFSLFSFLMLTSTWAHSVQFCTLRISKCFIPWVKFHFKFLRSILSTEWIFKRLLKLIIKTEKDCGCPKSAKMLYLSLLPLSRGFCPYPINIVSYAAALFSSRNAPPTFVGRSVAWRDKERLRRRLP